MYCILVDLQSTLKKKCGHCDSLCEDIAYNYETTFASLQDSRHGVTIWKDVHPKMFPNGPPTWYKIATHYTHT